MGRLPSWPLLALFATLAAAPPTAPPDASIWSDLPPEIRPYIFLSIADVPPYPVSNDSLLDPHTWPTRHVFEGKTCRLQFGSENGTSEVDSVWNVADDLGSTACYKVPPAEHESLYAWLRMPSGYSPRRYEDLRGPAYDWGPGRRLWRRAYYRRSGLEEWIYDDTGKLRQFSSYETGNVKETRFSSRQLFDPMGRLQGFMLAICPAGTPDSSATVQAYWDGERLPVNEGRARIDEYWQGIEIPRNKPRK